MHAFASDPARGLFILVFLAIVHRRRARCCTRGARRGSGRTAAFDAVSRESFLLFNNVLLVAATGADPARHAVSRCSWTRSTSARFPSARRISTRVPGADAAAAAAARRRHARGVETGPARSYKTRLLRVLRVVAVCRRDRSSALLAYGEFRPMTTVGVALALLGHPVVAARSRSRACARGKSLPAACSAWSSRTSASGSSRSASPGAVLQDREGPRPCDRVETRRSAAMTSSSTAMRDVRGPELRRRRSGRRRHARRQAGHDPASAEAHLPRADNADDGGRHRGRRWHRDLFAALGDDLGQGRWSLRLQYKPLVRFIWLGALLMALGGFDRGHRPALSRARRGRATAQAARAALPP